MESKVNFVCCDNPPTKLTIHILAAVAEHKLALFDHLRQRWQDLFGASFEILLYDLTSTYFEAAPPDSLASKSKDEHHLPAGIRVPSIRSFAQRHRVSRFTVVEAYDRLVAMGYLYSRRGAGFYAQAPQPVGEQWPRYTSATENEELVCLIRRSLEADENTIFPGGGWLPNDWFDLGCIRQSLNVLTRKNGAHLVHYGKPYGYLPLREHLCLLLGDIGVTSPASQILLTTGASQALDLIIRLLLGPGDTASSTTPAIGILRLYRGHVVGVPRKSEGPDIDALARLAAQHQPKMYVSQTVMHNPTDTTMAPHVVHRVLQLGLRIECARRLVEDQDRRVL
jgi:DNA-binding transcriptional MocR family regulator